MSCVIIITVGALYKINEEETATVDLDLLWQEPLSLTFIQKHERLADWKVISKFARINHEFIRHYFHRLDWKELLQNHLLSEELLEEFSDYLNWDAVAKNQILSSCFIKEHENSLNLSMVLKYQKHISPQIKLYLSKKQE